MAARRGDWFGKLWSTRNEDRKTTYAKPVRRDRPDATKEDRQRNAVIEAAERRRRQWEQYLTKRKYRLDQLGKEFPGVRKYARTLEALSRDPECEWTGPRDCNIDLADLCDTLGLAGVPNSYDRYLLLELSRDFVSSLGKRAGIEPERLVDDPSPLPLEGQDRETEVDRVKMALRLH